MQPPRIHFVGRFRADVATDNNEDINYLYSSLNDSLLKRGWNPIGTNTWAMIDCVITSAVYNVNGETVTVTNPEDDGVIGLPLINNPERAFAKIVDVDPDQQLSSTIYGMDLGVNWDPNDESRVNAFHGQFHPSVITRDVWPRQSPSGVTLQQPFASHSVSQLENVHWGPTENSEALRQIKELSQNKSLSITFAIFNYTRPPTEDWFTYGNLVGSIGVAEPEESLAFPENRSMMPKGFFCKFPQGSHCENTTMLMTFTYFDIVDSTMTIDFSNSLAIGVDGKLCKLYPYYVGILLDQTIGGPKVEIVGEVPYMTENWYITTAGIQDFNITDDQLKLIRGNSKVVVVTVDVTLKKRELIENGKLYPVCAPGSSSESCVSIILEEEACLVRPMNYFVFRMEQNNQATVRFKVKYFGSTPNETTSVTLFDRSPNSPASGSLVFNQTANTNSEGIAIFNFTAGNVGEPRQDLRIDGQVFAFGYCTQSCIDECDKCQTTNIGNVIVFLVWSPMEYKRPYFWDTHVKPIFIQYQNLYPSMSDILKLGDYDDVTHPGNVRLLNLSMALDINHPSHMPVTRDLSPTKRDMILEWLNTPDHPRNWEDVEQRLYETPHFCEHTVYKYGESKKKKNEGVERVSIKTAEEVVDDEEDVPDEIPTLANSDVSRSFSNVALSRSNNTADLPRWLTDHCTPESLKRDLQTAIALEFSTIPTYMTSLYSIKDGYNGEVYSTIRSVIMQEMLHLAQAANLLISIGGQPRMTDPSVSQIPTSFPTNLPGKVLPGLLVTLQKASPKHIADVFMMIEFPDKVVYEGAYHEESIDLNALTIGEFYTTIRTCMANLSNASEITFGNEERQLHWPWEMYDKTSKLWKVTSMKTARKAIKMIVEQGEGTDQLDPTYLGTQQLAHFFKFEELACKHHIEASHEHTYDFHGKEIEFVSEGVWPMQNNPSSKNLPKGTQVYHEAKIFHRIYRSLLESIETTFSGHPDTINEAVYIMEAMQMQAKKLMKMEVPVPPGHPNQTCGPIFDYYWDSEDE